MSKEPTLYRLSYDEYKTLRELRTLLQFELDRAYFEDDFRDEDLYPGVKKAIEVVEQRIKVLDDDKKPASVRGDTNGM